jgi:hypothetical protein
VGRPDSRCGVCDGAAADRAGTGDHASVAASRAVAAAVGRGAADSPARRVRTVARMTTCAAELAGDIHQR